MGNTETLYSSIGVVSSKEYRDFQPSTESLVEHEPCLKRWYKWEPWKKCNGNEYNHPHPSIIKKGNGTDGFPQAQFLHQGFPSYGNLEFNSSHKGEYKLRTCNHMETKRINKKQKKLKWRDLRKEFPTQWVQTLKWKQKRLQLSDL